MTFNEAIHQTIEVFRKGPSAQNLYHEKPPIIDLEPKEWREILSWMVDKKLLKLNQANYHQLDTWGIEIKNKQGGWLKHIEEEKESKELEEAEKQKSVNRQDKQDKKLDLDIQKVQNEVERIKVSNDLTDANLKKLNRDNFWFKITFPFAIIGGVVSCITLYQKGTELFHSIQLEETKTKTQPTLTKQAANPPIVKIDTASKKK